MTKLLAMAAALIASAALAAAGSASAAVYAFNFEGQSTAPAGAYNPNAYGDVVVNGLFTVVGDLTPGGSPLAITHVSGSVSGGSSSIVDGPITGLSSYAGSDNLLYASGINTGNYYSFAGVSFTVNNGTQSADYNLFGNYNSTVNLLVSTIDSTGYPQNGTPALVPSFQQPVTNSVTPVPEPATWALMALGLGLIGGALRARRSAAPAAA